MPEGRVEVCLAHQEAPPTPHPMNTLGNWLSAQEAFGKGWRLDLKCTSNVQGQMVSIESPPQATERETFIDTVRTQR